MSPDFSYTLSLTKKMHITTPQTGLLLHSIVLTVKKNRNAFTPKDHLIVIMALLRVILRMFEIQDGDDVLHHDLEMFLLTVPREFAYTCRHNTP